MKINFSSIINSFIIRIIKSFSSKNKTEYCKMSWTNSGQFSVITDDELRQLKIIKDFKINYDLTFINFEKSNRLEDVEESGVAGAIPNQTIRTFDIKLLTNKVTNVCKNEEFTNDEFEYFREIFKNTKLTEFLFEFNIDIKCYGFFFVKVFEKILEDFDEKKNFKATSESKKNEYDHENILKILFEIFKNKFHGDFQTCYENFMLKSDKNIKNDDERIFQARKNFFKENEFLKKMNNIFAQDHIEKNFFDLAKKALDYKLLDIVKLIFDCCFIKLDDDVKIYICKPLKQN